MLTSIEIENFKGIRDRVRFELRPITLLFGANSSGKSSVVQAIHYAREILERLNLNPDKTGLGGEGMDLGGFQTFVHGHDVQRPIRLRFDLDLTRTDLPDYGLMDYRLINEGGEDEQVEMCDHLSPEVKSAWIEFEVSWSEEYGAAQVTSYKVGLNGLFFSQIEALHGGVKVPFARINKEHPLAVSNEHLVEEEMDSPLAGVLDLLSSFCPAISIEDNEDFKTEGVKIEIEEQDSAIPVWGRTFKLAQAEKMMKGDFTPLEVRESIRVLSQAIIGPGELLRDELRGFRYIGPMRDVPPRNYEEKKTQDDARWACGLGGWDLLCRRGSEFVTKVSKWLNEEARLNSGYRIELREFKELNGSWVKMIEEGRGLDAFDLLEEELPRLPMKKRLILIEDETGLEVLPQDVGVGISQVLPIVSGALDNWRSIFAIEQPELHIHPAMQVVLGDLFIEATKDGDRCFLIETHSEHIMLRLIRRIRETNDNELPPGAPELTPDRVAVHYVENTRSSGVVSTLLEIDKGGEFRNRWPKGFFDERGEELF